jgi:hypothetical protein
MWKTFTFGIDIKVPQRYFEVNYQSAVIKRKLEKNLILSGPILLGHL